MKVFFAGENALAPSGWPEEVIIKQKCSWGCCSFKAVTQQKQRGGQWLTGFRGSTGKADSQNQVGKALWVQPFPQDCQGHHCPVSPSTTSPWLQAWAANHLRFTHLGAMNATRGTGLCGCLAFPSRECCWLLSSQLQQMWSWSPWHFKELKCGFTVLCPALR